MTYKNSLNLHFPTYFTVKIMGKAGQKFEDSVQTIAYKYFPKEFVQYKRRWSKDKNYLSMNVVLYVQNQIELDNFYREISASPEVIMVL